MEFQTTHGPVAVTVATGADLNAIISKKYNDNQGFSLATLNLDHLVKMNADQPFYTAYSEHDIVVADGNPIVWMSKMAGHPIDLLPGSDLVAPLSQQAAEAGMPVAMLGSTESALDGAAEVLKYKFPDLNVVCKISPAFGFDPMGEEAKAALDAVHASGARLCFLALGAPKQEMLAIHGRARAPQTGFVSIGAGLDFLTGAQERAPKWARSIAMEWLWRLVSNPKRMAGRYAKCFAILPRQVLNALQQRKRSA
ncbi:MAG: WecB/TagA/CpsF family glycosyltransferase [Cognatishimia sp.]|uniref:WecB/TagA/CpsF family glycosyltransferase n=1 Tax=Cognatishimia sp. TaxID=2211648 RepID=UPI003B8D7D77